MEPFHFSVKLTRITISSKGKTALSETLHGSSHKVLERHPSDKHFKIEVNGNPKVVSTELLKPAYFIPEELAQLFSEQL